MEKELLVTIFDVLPLPKERIIEHHEIESYLNQGYEIKSFQQSVVTRSEKESYKIAITVLLVLSGSENGGSPDQDA